MTDVEIERLRKVAWGVVANAGRLSPKRKPRWSHVMDAMGLHKDVWPLLNPDG